MGGSISVGIRKAGEKVSCTPQVAVPYDMFESDVGRVNEIDPESVNRIGSGAELLRCATGRGCRPGKKAVRGSTLQ